MTVRAILQAGLDATLAQAMLDAYGEIEQNYVLQKWKPSELDAGHFVEAVRRALDLELHGNYTPLTQRLPSFDDAALKRYEQATGHESYRLLIPRALKAVYNIRSKRGVAHVSDVSPNEMDATFILYAAKWVLAELVRLKSKLSPEETQKLVNTIVERRCPLIWSEEGIRTVLVPTMTARDQVLVLLYDRSPSTQDELQQAVGYSNSSRFRSILRDLHKAKLIYRHEDGSCRISPSGVIEAERMIEKYQ